MKDLSNLARIAKNNYPKYIPNRSLLPNAMAVAGIKHVNSYIVRTLLSNNAHYFHISGDAMTHIAVLCFAGKEKRCSLIQLFQEQLAIVI